MIVNSANMVGLFMAYSTAFNKTFTETTTTYEKIATTVPSSTGSQSYAWLGQIPRVREWIGEREIQKLGTHDYTIKNKPFEVTVEVSRDNIEDDTYGVYTPLFSALGESAALHPDDLVWSMVMKGFTERCYDGSPFFSDQHLVGKQTFSNITDEKLSLESYQKARTNMMCLVGEQGKALKLVPDLLVVSPANEYRARQILKAELINGTTNTMKDTAEILVEPQLAEQPDFWCLLCTSKFLKPFIYQERKKMNLVSRDKDTDENVFKKATFQYGGDGRGNAGYGFWQMAYGSTGEREVPAEG